LQKWDAHFGKKVSQGAEQNEGNYRLQVGRGTEKIRSLVWAGRSTRDKESDIFSLSQTDCPGGSKKGLHTGFRKSVKVEKSRGGTSRPMAKIA